MSVMKELSFDDVRVEAERPPLMLVLSDDHDAGVALAEQLSGEAYSPYVTVLEMGVPVSRLGAYESIVLFDPETKPESRLYYDELKRTYPDQAVVPFVGADPTDRKANRAVRNRIFSKLPERVPSFGRHMPGFRDQAVTRVINETAMANGQFALIANIPSIVPLFGAVATVSAEMLVLTKNQILLAYKVAAIHGEELHDTTGFVRGIIPVAGTGLIWRTLAREAVTFLPFAAGTIPKVAIAYSGTVAVGRSTDYYFRYGEKPSKELIKTFYQLGMESVKTRTFPVWKRRNGTVDVDFQVLDNGPEDDFNYSGAGAN